MGDRALGFNYFVSCGNQIGATIEDYVEYFLHDPDISVVAIVVEALKSPRRLPGLARSAHAQRKSLLLFQAGRSAAGRVMVAIAYRRACGRRRNPRGVPAALRDRAGREPR